MLGTSIESFYTAFLLLFTWKNKCVVNWTVSDVSSLMSLSGKQTAFTAHWFHYDNRFKV